MSGRAATINVIPGAFALSVGLAEMPAPKGWRWVSLTEVARLESGHTPSRLHPEYWNGGIPWISIKDARMHHGEVITETHQTVTQAGLDNSAARLLPVSTVCLSRTASVGYVVVMGRVMATSQDFVNWICSPSIEPHFLKLLLIAENESLFRFGKGSTHTTIYYPEVKAFHVCLPPPGEQRRIVTKLEALQARSRGAREALDTVPPLLDKLRQSILAAAFRGDLTKDWRAKHKDVEPATELLKRIRTERRRKWKETELSKLKAKGKAPADDKWKAKYKESEPVDATGLPELPEGWCWARLADLMLSLDQGWSPQCESAPRTSDEQWAVMKTTAVQHNRFDENENKRLPQAMKPRPGTELQVGDLLITRAGPRVRAGVCCRVDKVGPRLMACDKVYRFRVDEEFAVGECVELILNSPRVLDDIEMMKTGISESGVNLTQDKFTSLVVPVPPVEEQRVLVQRARAAVRDCDRFLTSQLEIATQIGILERATLAKAFRGDLEPQDPNDEDAEAMLARVRQQSCANAANGTSENDASSQRPKKARVTRARTGS